MDAREIIKDYLKKNNFDGLVNSGLCGCSIDDLIQCESDPSGCEPAYAIKGQCTECQMHCDGFDEDDDSVCYTTNKPKEKNNV